MLPRRHTSWRSLIIGLVAIGSVAVLAVWVLLAGRVGALHGDRYRLFLLTADASRVVKGTEVWLEGQKVGLVSTVSLRPVSADRTRRVVIELEVLREFQPEIRSDSYAHFGHAGTPIGTPVLLLDTGTPAARVLVDGDTILARETTNPRELMARIAGASQQFPRLVANVHAIAKHLDQTAGRVDQLPSARAAGIRSSFERTAARIALLGRRVNLPHARAGRAGRSGAVSAHATGLGARVDSIAAAAITGHGTMARLRQDTSIATTLEDMGRRITLIGSLLRQRRGSVGRLSHDRAVKP